MSDNKNSKAATPTPAPAPEWLDALGTNRPTGPFSPPEPEFPREVLDAIERARLALGWESMQARNRDALDFHQIPVWNAARLVEIGFKAGYEAAMKAR